MLPQVRNLVSAAETEELIVQAEAGNVTHKLERSMVGRGRLKHTVSH